MNPQPTAPIDQVFTGTGSVLKDFSAFVGGSNVNVLYKAFVLVAILVILGLIPATQKVAVYAGWAILVLLLIQQNP